MSQSTTMDYAETVCKAITGIVQVFRGEPDKMPTTGFPLIVLNSDQPEVDRLTFHAGGNGQQEVRFGIDVDLYLGAKDTPPHKVQQLALIFPDRLRVAFADFTMGGRCDNLDLVGLGHNLTRGAYRFNDGECPRMSWRLLITEYEKANTAAS